MAQTTEHHLSQNFTLQATYIRRRNSKRNLRKRKKQTCKTQTNRKRKISQHGTRNSLLAPNPKLRTILHHRHAHTSARRKHKRTGIIQHLKMATTTQPTRNSQTSKSKQIQENIDLQLHQNSPHLPHLEKTQETSKYLPLHD